MEVPLLPFALGAILLTFALAVLGWWVASRVEARRRTARRTSASEGDRPRDAGSPDREP